AAVFLDILRSAHARNLDRINVELKSLGDLEPSVRGSATELLSSTSPAVTQAAVTVLGMIAHPHDAEAVEPMLEFPNAAVREAAAVALGRMANAGLPILSRILVSGPAREKALAMVALSHE